MDASRLGNGTVVPPPCHYSCQLNNIMRCSSSYENASKCSDICVKLQKNCEASAGDLWEGLLRLFHILTINVTETRSACRRAILLANMFERVRYYVIARPSVVCLSSVFLSSVTFVRRTQPVKIFGNISTPLGTLAIG